MPVAALSSPRAPTDRVEPSPDSGALLGVPVDRGPPARWRLKLAGAVVREAGDRRLDGRLSPAADRRWPLRGWIIAAGVGARWQLSDAIDGTAGRVSLDGGRPERGFFGGTDKWRDGSREHRQYPCCFCA
jgi:hypothetical protein